MSYSPTLGQLSGLFKLLPAPADRFRWLDADNGEYLSAMGCVEASGVESFRAK